MIIKKKTWPEFFQKVIDGDKTFEIRLNDFKCRPGDTLILEEWDPKTKQYTGRTLKKKVAFVIKTKNIKFWPKKDIEKYGLQVIAFN